MFEFILKALSPKKISKKVEKKIDKFVKDLPINAEADVTSVKLFSAASWSWLWPRITSWPSFTLVIAVFHFIGL